MKPGWADFGYNFPQKTASQSVADPGFPVGGRGPRTGGRGPPRRYVSKILHVKTKESGSVGGVTRRARPPRSANVNDAIFINVSHIVWRSCSCVQKHLNPQNLNLCYTVINTILTVKTTQCL